jgi:hypothetical protein
VISPLSHAINNFVLVFCIQTSMGSSVSVVTGYGLDDGGSIAGRGMDISLRHCI